MYSMLASMRMACCLPTSPTKSGVPNDCNAMKDEVL